MQLGALPSIEFELQVAWLICSKFDSRSEFLFHTCSIATNLVTPFSFLLLYTKLWPRRWPRQLTLWLYCIVSQEPCRCCCGVRLSTLEYSLRSTRCLKVYRTGIIFQRWPNIQIIPYKMSLISSYDFHGFILRAVYEFHFFWKCSDK